MSALQAALTAQVSTPASGNLTLLHLRAPANQRLRIMGWGFNVPGIVVTDVPFDVRLLFQSADGTFTSKSPVHRRQGMPEALQALGFHTATVEPTTDGDQVHPEHLHPQVGGAFPDPMGTTEVQGGQAIGLKVFASTKVLTGNAWIWYEE